MVCATWPRTEPVPGKRVVNWEGKSKLSALSEPPTPPLGKKWLTLMKPLPLLLVNVAEAAFPGRRLLVSFMKANVEASEMLDDAKHEIAAMVKAKHFSAGPVL